MKIAVVITFIISGVVHAGGVECTDQSVGVLFEQGRYLEFGLTGAMPDVSGAGSAISPTPDQSSGNIAEDYNGLRVSLTYCTFPKNCFRG